MPRAALRGVTLSRTTFTSRGAISSMACGSRGLSSLLHVRIAAGTEIEILQRSRSRVRMKISTVQRWPTLGSSGP